MPAAECAVHPEGLRFAGLGMQSRLSRIFNPQSNRTVMLALTTATFRGPTTGLERIDPRAPLFGKPTC